MEVYFEDYIKKYSDEAAKLTYAKAMLCLSHDWFQMGDDDKGSELLEKASKVCPTYFDKEIKLDMKEDPLFEVLVENLTLMILEVAKSVLGV